ncbi:MAG: DUF4097 family beta strand repeat protein [Armatimonadetes bacterium]|nr:DUF4097 family beta strand repeat protein [Armatimonadota bacterium]
MNKEQMERILKMVQEGKLSAADAAELIEAMGDGDTADSSTQPPQTDQAAHATSDQSSDEKTQNPPRDPFSSIIDTIEKIGKDVASSVNWQDVSAQIRQGVNRGGEALKSVVEEAKRGGFVFKIGHVEHKKVELPFFLPEGKALKIENWSGDISVTGGAESSVVIANAEIRGSDQADAVSKAATYIPVLEESDGFLLIRQPDLSGFHVDLEIKLAQTGFVEVRSRSGDVTLHSTGGGCRVQVDSGDVTLNNLNGPVEASTSSGDIKVFKVEGPSITLESKSGDVKETEVRSVSNLVKTASGDITFEACSGKTVSVEAVAGDVKIDLDRALDGNVTIRSVQGDTMLSVPGGGDCRVTLSTLRGEVDCMLELEEMNRQDKRITGRLGDGTGSLDVSGISGNIKVRQRLHV